jgi:hypothetical protein
LLEPKNIKLLIYYLDYLSKLPKEDLNEYNENFSVHDNDFPVVSLRDSVAIVQKPKFSFGIHQMKLIPLLVNK